MLPGDGVFTEVTHGADFLEPDNLNGFGRRVDYERGGFGLNNAEGGLDYQNWQVSWDKKTRDIVLTSDNGFRQAMFKVNDLTQLALAFDQSMTPYFAYTEAGLTWLQWRLPSGEYDRMLIPAATQPRLTLDDKRPESSLIADVLLFYIRAGNIYHRVQRENFATEHLVVSGVRGTRLGRLGFTTDLRVQIELLP